MSATIVKFKFSDNFGEKVNGEKRYIGVFFFSKGKRGLLGDASANGDAELYQYPIDCEVLFHEKDKDECEKQAKTFIGEEDTDINLVDISVKELGLTKNGQAVTSVTFNNDNMDRAVRNFRRASYGDRESIVSRLYAQLERQRNDEKCVYHTEAEQPEKKGKEEGD